MNINYLLSQVNLFLKLASQDAAGDLARSGNIAEAAKILGVSTSATEEEIKRAYRGKALEWHPDRPEQQDKAKAENMMKLFNAARDILIKHVKEKGQKTESFFDETINQYYHPHDDPNKFYEDISKKVKEVGMEAFNRDNPGLLDEIMREMGSDNFNKIFYDYDPKYDPSEDVDVQRDLEAMVQAAYDKASDNIHLRPIENRLSSMSREDKLSLVESLNKPEELKQIVIRLGGVVEPVVTSIDLHDKEIFDDLPESELKRAKESALHDAVKIFIKNNWDEFVDTVSLKEILQNPGKYFILLNPGIHLSKKQLTEVLDDNFREFIGAEQRREYQHSHPMYKEKVSFKNATKERINRVLYSLLIQYLKSQGHSNARAFAGMEEIFEKFEKVSPEEYEHLVAVADPANYF